MRLGIAIAAALLLAGCAGQSSTLDAGSGERQTFNITAEQADHVLLAAFKDEFPSYQPEYFNGPAKGYKIRFTFMLDFQNIAAAAIAVPVKGPDGASHTEYAFQVTNDGSSFVQGKIYADNLFHTIVRLATEQAAANPRSQ
jgi:hypothetical protein